ACHSPLRCPVLEPDHSLSRTISAENMILPCRLLRCSRSLTLQTSATRSAQATLRVSEHSSKEQQRKSRVRPEQKPKPSLQITESSWRQTKRHYSHWSQRDE